MNIHPSVRKLLIGIITVFPDVGVRMKRRAREMRTVEFATTEMMNEFSNATSDAIRKRQKTIALSHLAYVSNLWVSSAADDKVREYIDVYYVEILMYDLDNESKKWGWNLMPANLRTLYIGMWGQPKF